MYRQVVSAIHAAMESITPIVVYRSGTEPDKGRYPDCTVFAEDEGKGKKYALHKAVSGAESEYVWLLDDDVNGARECWERLSETALDNADMYILPLCMTDGGGRLIERLQQLEYAGIQTLTMLTAEKGRAVMCSGANLLVKRRCWLESWQDLHTEIPSGDDMFLLESFKRRGLKIETLPLTVTIEPQPTLRGLFRQRMRWAGKAPSYTDKDIRRCGMAVVLLNLFSVLVPPVWLLKLLMELSILRRACQRYPFTIIRHSFFHAILLSLLYPWYMLVCLLGGIAGRHRTTDSNGF